MAADRGLHTWVQITAIDETRRTARVHNLTVDGVHTYYALAAPDTTPRPQLRRGS
ncbi:hypothetical protein LUW77_09390 [Streptomyces radiopugnans]|nr:hypothetical protein LUW77_09390 [Streptomyces radiopugnans]